MYPKASFGNYGFGDYPIGRRWMDDPRKHLRMEALGEAILFDEHGHPEIIWFREKKRHLTAIGYTWRFFVAWMDNHDKGDEDDGNRARL